MISKMVRCTEGSSHPRDWVHAHGQGTIRSCLLGTNNGPSLRSLFAHLPSNNAAGEYEKAVRDLDVLLQLNSSQPALYGARALAKQMRGDYESALKDCSTMIELEPSNPAGCLSPWGRREPFTRAPCACATLKGLTFFAETTKHPEVVRFLFQCARSRKTCQSWRVSVCVHNVQLLSSRTQAFHSSPHCTHPVCLWPRGPALTVSA